jgi:SCP-2 sterol transfer family
MIEEKNREISHSLEQLCSEFQNSVISKLLAHPQNILLPFQGLYLFFIHQNPAFYLKIGLPPESGNFNAEELNQMPSPRCQIQTDAKTLERILKGTLKPKVAFLSGKVEILGDVPAFLKLVSFLKSEGVRPQGNGSVKSN